MARFVGCKFIVSLNILFATSGVVLGCASRVLQYDHADKALQNEEYDKQIQVKPAEPPPQPQVSEIAPAVTEKKSEDKIPVVDKKGKKKKVVSSRLKEPNKKKEQLKVKPKGPRQPEIEDIAGFDGRRPLKDPFRPGEKVTLSLSYFNIVAGTMDVMVKPMVEVNGEKAYHFEVHAQSNSLFSRIYGVDDTATTYLSYDEMVPLNLAITLKESKQLAEARTFIDWKSNKANYWQKKVTKEHGEESKKIDWNVLPYSQNVISAAFYMRTFSYELGKSYAFRVADEGKNIVFTAEVIRKEKLSTDVGEFNAIVLKPKITVDGAFAPVGDILVWMSDDDRKFILRIESKIKIGTLVAKIKALDKGQD